MVHLQTASAVDSLKYPNAFRWDNLVRKHFSTYQELIDAQTYRLQRIQRSFLVPLPSLRHFPIPVSTILSYWLSTCWDVSRRSARSTRKKSTSIKTSIPVLRPISTELSAQDSIYPILVLASVVVSSSSPLTSLSASQLELSWLLYPFWSIGCGLPVMPATNNAVWTSWIGSSGTEEPNVLLSCTEANLIVRR